MRAPCPPRPIRGRHADRWRAAQAYRASPSSRCKKSARRLRSNHASAASSSGKVICGPALVAQHAFEHGVVAVVQPLPSRDLQISLILYDLCGDHLANAQA